MKSIIKTNSIINDEYTNYIYENFEIQNKSKTSVTIHYDLDSLNDFDWNIGVIYGGSGID